MPRTRRASPEWLSTWPASRPAQRLNSRIGALSVSPCGCFGGRSSAIPATGAQMPDYPGGEQREGHDREKRNVYSPASLRAKPTGTNAAIVTSVPVRRGSAVDS